MLKIGYFSKLSRISIRMLRHYNDIGLLMPNTTHPETGYRYYSPAQLVIANRITELRQMGFGLADIAQILADYEDGEAMKAYFAERRQEIAAQADRLEKQQAQLEAAYNRLKSGGNHMKYNVVLKEIPARNVASVRQIIPSYDKEGLLWEMLMRETMNLGLKYAEDVCSSAVFHDKEYKEKDADVEIMMSVQGEYADTEHVRFRKAPAQQVASVTFTGGFSQVQQVNETVAQWVEDNGYEMCGPMFNIYHVGPGQSHNPNEWVTEACFPVEKR